MQTPLPKLHLLDGTDLRVGPNTLGYLQAQRKKAPNAVVSVLGTHAKTGLPVRVDVDLGKLGTAALASLS